MARVLLDQIDQAGTGNPYWHAEQLAGLPAEFRVVGGPEVRACVRRLGQRMLAAAREG